MMLFIFEITVIYQNILQKKWEILIFRYFLLLISTWNYVFTQRNPVHMSEIHPAHILVISFPA